MENWSTEENLALVDPTRMDTYLFARLVGKGYGPLLLNSIDYGRDIHIDMSFLPCSILKHLKVKNGNRLVVVKNASVDEIQELYNIGALLWSECKQGKDREGHNSYFVAGHPVTPQIGTKVTLLQRVLPLVLHSKWVDGDFLLLKRIIQYGVFETSQVG